MPKLRVLNADQIRAAVTWPEAIEAMRSAFGQLSAGEAVMPQRTVVATRLGQTLVMPSYLSRSEDLAIKVVSVHPDNRSRGLPLIQGLVTVLDASTGTPLAVMDAATVTALRTAAGSALATELLARLDTDTLAVFGAGVQAGAHAEAIATVRFLQEIRIYSPSQASAKRLADSINGKRGAGGAMARAVESPSDALLGAQLVVTATTSQQPVCDGRLIEAGTHVNAVGAWRPNCRELDDAVLRKAKIVVDHRPAAWEEAGELIQACQTGAITRESIWADLGELVNGARPGRQSSDEITLFKSVGLAVQDAALARTVLLGAERNNLGTLVEL
ncbi:MAG: ornithine cyclodeaminase family protein [Planctomycetes bacterium]|nr:ornithine cyclodeaminase family protein [Planctomycetota bacterium]